MPAGLAIVLTHNVWVADWRVLITILGWLAAIGGAVRILAPQRTGRVGRSMLRQSDPRLPISAGDLSRVRCAALLLRLSSTDNTPPLGATTMNKPITASDLVTPKVTTGPLAGSRKIYSQPDAAPDLRVPLREIVLSEGAKRAEPAGL